MKNECDVAGCFCVYEGKILLLQRAKAQKGTWGVPAGRQEDGESIKETVIREIFEESNIELKEPEYIGKLSFSFQKICYTFHMYREFFLTEPKVVLNKEHTDYCWVTTEEALKLPLIAGGIEAFQFFRRV